MAAPNLNNLLKWSVENSTASRNDPGATKSPATKFDGTALQKMLGGITGPTDAEMMTKSMNVIEHEQTSLEDKVVAFKNLNMLIENLDNANNLAPLGLWTPLAKQLENPEAKLRALAAWCCSVAVQNNIKTQERLLISGAIPTLMKLAIEDPDFTVRKKAVGALSSVARNFQSGLDAVILNLPTDFKPQGTLDASDMNSVDSVINPLRASYASLQEA